MKIYSASVHLTRLLEGIRETMREDAARGQVELLVQPADVTVMSDRLRLRQILLNLASNAVRCTPAGGTVTLAVVQGAAETEGTVPFTFVVRDTGIGMSERQQRRAISSSGHQEGGLGLAIVRQTVSEMGGTMSVQSKEGQGSEFRILLPLPVVSEDAR